MNVRFLMNDEEVFVMFGWHKMFWEEEARTAEALPKLQVYLDRL